MSYASDNDGSAFITKAEFDSLKSSFQSQLDEYNTGIDAKIDSAIAAYLAGIKLEYKPINLYDSIIALYGKPLWLQKGIPIGSASIISEITSLSTKHLTSDEFSKIGFCWHQKGGGHMGWNYYLDSYIYNGDSFIWSEAGAGRTNTIASYAFHTAAGAAGAYDKTCDTIAAPGVNGVYAGAADSEHALVNKQVDDYQVLQAGAGSVWLTQTQGNITFLKFFSSLFYPSHSITSWYHVYKDWVTGYKGSGQTYKPYLQNNGRGIYELHASPSLIEKPGGLVEWGTKYGDDETTVGDYYSLRHSLIKTSDGNRYFECFFSDTSNPTVYYVDEGYSGELEPATSSVIIPDSTFEAVYYQSTGGTTQTNTYKGGEFKTRKYEIYVDTAKLNSFDSYIASTIAGDPVKNIGGCPIAEVVGGGQNIVVKFKILSSDVTDTASVEFASTPFNCGSVSIKDSYGKLTAVQCDETEYTLNIMNAKKGLIYIFIKNDTSDNSLQITSLDVEKGV